MNDIGKILYEERKRQHLGTKAMAEISGVAVPTIYRAEKNLATIYTVTRLLNALGVTLAVAERKGEL